jgi:hypothetical protein
VHYNVMLAVNLMVCTQFQAACSLPVFYAAL